MRVYAQVTCELEVALDQPWDGGETLSGLKKRAEEEARNMIYNSLTKPFPGRFRGFKSSAVSTLKFELEEKDRNA